MVSGLAWSMACHHHAMWRPVVDGWNDVQLMLHVRGRLDPSSVAEAERVYMDTRDMLAQGASEEAAHELTIGQLDP